jgi:hypothetical protein
MDEAINVCKDSIAEKGKKILEKRSQEESIDLLEEVLYVMNIITIIILYILKSVCQAFGIVL